MADVKIIDIDSEQWNMKDQNARDRLTVVENKLKTSFQTFSLSTSNRTKRINVEEGCYLITNNDTWGETSVQWHSEVLTIDENHEGNFNIIVQLRNYITFAYDKTTRQLVCTYLPNSGGSTVQVTKIK